MNTELGKNHFELFALEASFEIDTETLAVRYRDLQRAVHPDRFAGAGDLEQRLAVQQAAQINEAFRTLKDPLLRGRYLLELYGYSFDENDSAMDPAFLMEQMELREELEAVRRSEDPFAALGKARDDIEVRERAHVELLSISFAEGGDENLKRAAETIRKMQFMQRLLHEVEELEEDLVHG